MPPAPSSAEESWSVVDHAQGKFRRVGSYSKEERGVLKKKKKGE
jgi:hypothetical protein